MKLFYTAVVTSALFSSTNATADNDRELMGMKLFAGEVESTEEATFNVDDIANEDDFDSLEATDKVKVLIKKMSEDVVFPTSFGLSLDLPEHNIVAGTMTREDYESIKDDSNIIVEIDREVGVLEKNHVTNLRRKLAENTPYGISMVLQDMNFWSKLGEPSGAIKVCVADTGYDLGHEDTPKGDDVTGTDNPEYSSDSWNKDPHGHGTHCSGTVSALGGNDKGVVGVIPNNADGKFQLVIANALMGSGSGSWAGVIAGVDTCVSNGAKVVSLSLGGYFYSAITEEYYKDLYEKQGILFVAAAGNGGNTNKLYPASYPSLMSVAAIDSNKNKASFSTYNDQVEISAPGVSIESSLPGNNYAKWSGTSMATPHVAGVAGLLWMYFPDCKNYQIRNAILATAEDLRADGCDIDTGFGVVRAKSAYELLAKGNCGGNLGVTDGETGGCDQLTAGPAPTSAPVPSAPSTSYPTHTAPTMYPTHTAPTPYPTEAAPTSRPTGKICADVLETCKKHADCCTKRCNRIKGECRAARKLTKAPTKAPAPTEEAGFCVTSSGRDQNSGVVKISGGDFGPSDEWKKKCLDACISASPHTSVTGCEAIWDQDNRGCYMHTEEIARGNGVDRHSCWVV